MKRSTPFGLARTLLLGTALAGLAACDREPESVPPDDGSEPTELTAGAVPTAQTSSEQPPATDAVAVPAVDPPAPEPETGRSLPARVTSAPSKDAEPAPPAASSDTDQLDEHAGHDMGSMSDYDMDNM